MTLLLIISPYLSRFIIPVTANYMSYPFNNTVETFLFPRHLN
jgi:hypothetical protein